MTFSQDRNILETWFHMASGFFDCLNTI